MVAKGQQLRMFQEIWATRPHVSEVSGKKLLPPSHSLWHWQFAHILSKGAYPRYKVNPDNIVMITPEEHHLFDFQTHKLIDKATGHVLDKAWQWVFDKAERLRQQYHRRG